MSARLAQTKRSGKVASVAVGFSISSIGGGGGSMFVVMLRVSLTQKPKNRKIAMQNTLVCANALPARCCHRVLSKKLIMAHRVMAVAVTAIWCDGNAALRAYLLRSQFRLNWIALFLVLAHKISWASVVQCFRVRARANKIRGNGGDKQLHTHTHPYKTKKRKWNEYKRIKLDFRFYSLQQLFSSSLVAPHHTATAVAVVTDELMLLLLLVFLCTQMDVYELPELILRMEILIGQLNNLAFKWIEPSWAQANVAQQQ